MISSPKIRSPRDVRVESMESVVLSDDTEIGTTTERPSNERSSLLGPTSAGCSGRCVALTATAMLAAAALTAVLVYLHL